MPANTPKASLSEELARLREKREVLEQLFGYAHQLTHLQDTMEVLKRMMKPSQTPDASTAAIAEYCKKAASVDTPELRSMLETLDKAVASDVEVIVSLSEPATKASMARRAQSARHIDTFAALKARLGEFRRKVEMNVAIRYILFERGVRPEAAKLPLSQNDVAERLDTVREEERHCRGRLKVEIEGMVENMQSIIANSACPNPLREHTLKVRDNLEQCLTILAQNRSLEELPTSVEVIELSGDDETGNVDPQAVPVADSRKEGHGAPAAAPEPAAPIRHSFWQRLRIWLDSPFSIRWRDIT